MSQKRRSKKRVVREDPVHAYRVREALGVAVLRGEVVSAADFKANCLSLMDEVRDKGAEFVITKHNIPVARLVPVLDEAESKFIGRGAGLITVSGDIVAPTAPDWEEGADI
ncbi:MAG: type II toxin-antitoxin system Phd/YefM family antitoxin [Gemmatimonadota bacterium]|nr:type II toxin-antitoxin system Phd/YefM family antitoxin [Gemmatimonadota bacterium]